MAFEFRFPDVGEGIHEGTIVKWLVKFGDEVKEDQALGEIETAKAIVEIPSPKTGYVLMLGAKEGGLIKVGDVLAVIGKKDEKYEPGKTKKRTEPKKGVGVVGELQEAGGSGTPLAQAKTQPAPQMAAGSGEINVLPFVRKLAEQLMTDLSKIIGTGPGGRITEDDVKKAASLGVVQTSDAIPPAEGKVSASSGQPVLKKIRKYDMWGYVDHVPYRGIRKTIAEHMVKSTSSAPHVTHFDRCDITALVARRGKEKTAAEKEGIKLTYLPYIVKAALKGLQEYPLLNATLDEANGDILVKKYYNIGIAVDAPDGLMVPVLKRVDQKSIFQLAKEIQELAEKARTRKIDMMDMKGSSFTISNIGSLGGTFFTPIINYPEVAILGVASIRKEPVARGKTVEVRDILHIGVTFDHRVVDGATAARFLNTVMKQLENPLFE